MTGLLYLADEVRMLLALLEKTFIKTEEIAPSESEVAYLDFHLVTLELKRVAGDLHRIAEDLLVEALDRDGVRRATIGERTVEVRRAYKRTDWEHSKVATHVALRATGGELVDGMAEVVDAFIKACRPEWRVSVLKEMGLDDEDYCSRELGRASVSVL